MTFWRSTRLALCALAAMGAPLAAVAEPISNPDYVVYPEPSLIRRDLTGLSWAQRFFYEKYVSYPVPNGGRVLILADADISDEQLLRAYAILDFYLSPAPGGAYGGDKSAVANAMGDQGAVLAMPSGADGDEMLPWLSLVGQPLYQLEFPTEGSPAYIRNDFERRDAGFEEIFHLVHDYGIGSNGGSGALKETYQAEISAATTHALENGLWGRGGADVQAWLRELAAEGSLEQEYIVSVIDSYYGLWAPWRGAGGMWGIYAAKTRADVDRLDPQGAALMRAFLPDRLTYMARIDPAFEGVFEMRFDPDLPYTHKSRYLEKARLLGDLPSGLSGNAYDNVLIGNDAPNVIDGADGVDVVQYPGPAHLYDVAVEGRGVVVSRDGDVDTLRNIEILRFTDRDVVL